MIEKAFKIKQKIERHVIQKIVCNKLFFKKDKVFIFKGSEFINFLIQKIYVIDIIKQREYRKLISEMVILLKRTRYLQIKNLYK